VKNYSLAEQEVFKLLKVFRMKQNREFFQFDNIQTAIEAIEIVVDRINVMTKDEIQMKLELNKKEKQKLFMTRIKTIKTNILFDKFKILFPEKDDICVKQLINLYEYCNCSDILCSEKVQLIKQFEELTNIEAFDVNLFYSEVTLHNLDDAFVSNIKNVFRMKKEKPTTNYEMKIFYVTLLKNLIGSLEVIGSKRQKTKERKNVINYFINYHQLNEYLKLLN
jgi:hypothetical protein